MYPSSGDNLILIGGFPSVLAGLRAMKFDAVEISVGRDNTCHDLELGRIDDAEHRLDLSTAEGVDKLRSQLSDNGMRASAFILHNDFGKPDVEGETAWVIGVLRTAHELGIPAVRIDSAMTGESDLPVEKRIDVFAQPMCRIIEATSDLDVDMGIENHGFQGNQPEFLDAIFERVGSGRLGMTLDTGNFYWAGHPLDRVYEILEHFAPITKHTHAKNICYPPETRNVQRELGWEYGKYVCPMRDGDIDHRRVVSMLKKAGYTRDLCLEDECLHGLPYEERPAVLLRDADYFREILAG